MEKKEQMIVETFLGLILIILLVIMVLLFTSAKTTTGNTTTSTTITNSFNTNYYNVQSPIMTRDYLTYYKKDHLNYKGNYLDYDYYAYKKTTKGIFGNDIEHYTVYVKNQGYKGGYFKVRYYFTDYYDDTETESIIYYIPARQGKEFTYKNIHKDKYKFYNWNYEVFSKTRV